MAILIPPTSVILTHTDKAADSGESSPVELPLKVLHVVMALGVISGLSLRKVMQTTQVVKLRGEINSV